MPLSPQLVLEAVTTPRGQVVQASVRWRDGTSETLHQLLERAGPPSGEAAAPEQTPPEAPPVPAEAPTPSHDPGPAEPSPPPAGADADEPWAPTPPDWLVPKTKPAGRWYRWALLDMLRRDPGKRTGELGRALGLTPENTTQHLKTLMAEDEVYAEGRTAGRRYYPVSYARERPPGRDDDAPAHVGQLEPPADATNGGAPRGGRQAASLAGRMLALLGARTLTAPRAAQLLRCGAGEASEVIEQLVAEGEVRAVDGARYEAV